MHTVTLFNLNKKIKNNKKIYITNMCWFSGKGTEYQEMYDDENEIKKQNKTKQMRQENKQTKKKHNAAVN